MSDFVHNHQPDRSRRLPPLRLMIVVFVGSMLISGVVIYAILDRIIETSSRPDYTEFVLQAAGGVRTIDPPRKVADFTLTAHTGKAFSLSDLRGRPVLLYFGYTHCPDVCPLTLIDLQKVDSLLGEDNHDMAYVFISVDGERDTPDLLARYLKQYQVEDTMIALSGEEIALNRITPDYNLYYELLPPEANGYYAVNHTASVFLLNEAGELSYIFAYGTSPAVIVQTIQTLNPAA